MNSPEPSLLKLFDGGAEGVNDLVFASPVLFTEEAWEQLRLWGRSFLVPESEIEVIINVIADLRSTIASVLYRSTSSDRLSSKKTGSRACRWSAPVSSRAAMSISSSSGCLGTEIASIEKVKRAFDDVGQARSGTPRTGAPVVSSGSSTKRSELERRRVKPSRWHRRAHASFIPNSGIGAPSI
jgi:hypothetical protein